MAIASAGRRLGDGRGACLEAARSRRTPRMPRPLGSVTASRIAAPMVSAPVSTNGNAKPPPIAAPNAPMTGPSTNPPIWNAE